MIFRTFNGTLVEINRYEFKKDTLYYKEILKCKIANYLSKPDNRSAFIQSLIKSE